jgi:DNA-directed RNA polymerase specialized sigma subunit
MTNKEYFQQAFWLDIQKETLHAEAESLRPFAQKNEKTAILLERIEAEIDAVIRHQEEIRAVIAALPRERERAVLRCRYLCKMKWEDIAAELDVDLRTARRWHDQALEHTEIPKNYF